jgi:AcrR family transcriptional regulator
MSRARAPMEETPKREAILAAALDLFAERGFHGTAVPSIADRAGVGAGTVYRYFESKEAIVNALYQQWKSEVARELLTDFSAGVPMRQQFHEIFVRLARFAAQHPRALAFLELHHHGSYLDAQSRAVEESMLEALRQFVRHGQAQQTIRQADPNLVIAMIWGAMVGVLRASWEGRVALGDSAVDALETCLWEAVRR